MSGQIELFPVEAFTDRLYYNDTSTRTKRPNQKGAARSKLAPQTSTNQVNQGT